MAETMVITIFFIILSVLQYKEQKLVVLKIRKSLLKKSISLGLVIAMLFFFWPVAVEEQLRLVIFSLLIAGFGLCKEGLGEDVLIKTGFIDAPYTDFQSITIENTEKSTSFVTFYKQKKNAATSFLIEADAVTVEQFLRKNTDGSMKIECVE